jgi:type IV pilus assembly protein PilV
MQPRVLHPSRRPAHRRGVALIEALIGFLIFAIGVLGLVGLQASMTKAQVGAKVRADAALLANEVLGLMWADSPANHPNYVGAACDAHPPCVDWQRKLKVTVNRLSTCAVMVGKVSSLNHEIGNDAMEP